MAEKIWELANLKCNMINFKKWFQISESKGIRLTDEIISQIRSSIDQIYQIAKTVKKEPEKEVFDVAVIKYADPYFKDRPRQVDIHVVNNLHQNNNGSFRNGYGIEINVAHVEEKDLTPKWVERVLAHELIHSTDPKISDFGTFQSVKNYDSSGGFDYYTHPFEFDAYTGQLAYSITQAADKLKGTDKESVLRTQLDNTLKFISNPDKSKAEKIYGVIVDPEYWKHYHIYFAHGSPQQKRKMHQRIYKAVMDAKTKLG